MPDDYHIVLITECWQMLNPSCTLQRFTQLTVITSKIPNVFGKLTTLRVEGPFAIIAHLGFLSLHDTMRAKEKAGGFPPAVFWFQSQKSTPCHRRSRGMSW